MCIENYEAKARRNVYLSMEELSWGKGKPQAATIVSFPAAVSIVSRDGLLDFCKLHYYCIQMY